MKYKDMTAQQKRIRNRSVKYGISTAEAERQIKEIEAKAKKTPRCDCPSWPRCNCILRGNKKAHCTP
jgi:hypothetical protein